jgi:hypothetical protein
MKVCVAVDNTTATKQVIGIITDTRPDNLINRDLKWTVILKSTAQIG